MNTSGDLVNKGLLGRFFDRERAIMSAPRPHRSRIFQNEFLEKLTLVRWWHIFVFWVPIIFWLFARNINQYGSSVAVCLLLLFSGVLTWTLAEYLIHRYPFHWNPKSEWGKRAVYIMHGNHHKDPKDPLRGVMPLFAAVFYVLILYSFFYLVIPAQYLDAYFASFLVGYLCYDGIHYYTHHAVPKNPVGRYLRRIHLVHHVHDDIIFGISSPLWDIVFGTYKKKGFNPNKDTLNGSPS
jgi:sterol desaturase/sphingolipid hydroxylase (fatty acid hydroxylase superfamily)